MFGDVADFRIQTARTTDDLPHRRGFITELRGDRLDSLLGVAVTACQVCLKGIGDLWTSVSGRPMPRAIFPALSWRLSNKPIGASY
jgi:hypothetical protein